ncbi:MAG: Ferredoxin, 2Fe-2S, partial [uncultured Sphingosinicella sp.]
AQAYRRHSRWHRNRRRWAGGAERDGSDPRQRLRRAPRAVRRLLLLRDLPCPCRRELGREASGDGRRRGQFARHFRLPSSEQPPVVPAHLRRRSRRPARADRSGGL